MIELPVGVQAMGARGPEWAAWVEELADLAQVYVDEWDLVPDGDAVHGNRSVALPVRTSDRALAVLKISFPDAASEHEHLVLRRWCGDGAVRLLRADPRRRALLLERLGPNDLSTLPDVDACEVVADLYRRVHVAALPQLPSLTMRLEQWTNELAVLPRAAPIPHRLVEDATARSRELITDVRDDNIVHGNLHYANILAAERAPWLVIAPQPLNGDPHYEIAPMLWHRWEELSGHIRDGVRRRFHTLVDAAGLGEDRARAWVVVRTVIEATHADRTDLTKYVAIAKAVQD